MLKKEFFQNLVALSFGVGLTYVSFELFFLILGTSSKFSLLRPIECDLNKETQITCFPRRESYLEGNYIKGSFFQKRIIAKKRTNDLGNFSEMNFDTFQKKSHDNLFKVASIGDSFVEAMQVDNKKTFHGLLNNKIIKKEGQKDFKIKSIAFGASGLAFPNYIKYIEFINNNIKDKNLIYTITVIPNDFDESFKEYKNIKVGQYYFKNKDSYEFIPLNDDAILKIKDFILDHSISARHLFFNLQISRFIMQYPICKLWTNCEKPEDIEYAANIKDSNFEDDKIRYLKGFEATDIFIEELKFIFDTAEKQEKVIFIIDSDRYNIYDNKIKKSKYFESQRNYLLTKLKKYNFKILDTQIIFKDDYLKNKKKFEFENDGHWNSYAHKIIYNKLYNDLIPKIEINPN